ncbi:MAG: ZIP family metal transporter [Bacteroidetes bacterium]|nr:ZIP family metal transporter [Bacteroidota bacterium]MBX7129336.1 ZIP family metal transporter [Flavobacteriales bacterium]MCC6654162.1 ZIP family metal transporter [Flavobacteriales bacterium]HMU14024.1 ZIP family metal transporter [Flavobacteriales bacterium]HMZ47673.1 ZIP family metal transporter [Flavobacteriales bacterium]
MGPLPLILLFIGLPLLAGLWLRRREAESGLVKLLLAFSGAFLLSVTVVHMLPELYEQGGHGIGPWVLAGFMLQVVLEFFSRGIEHGHVHVHAGHARTLPLMTLLSLCAHSFTEGLPFADEAVRANLPFVVGVLMHKAPMAIALATVLRRSDVTDGRYWTMIGVFAISLPIGMLVGIAGGDRLGGGFLEAALALAIGMLLHISTTIIFETTPDHRFDPKRFLTVLAGAGLAFLSMH